MSDGGDGGNAGEAGEASAGGGAAIGATVAGDTDGGVTGVGSALTSFRPHAAVQSKSETTDMAAAFTAGRSLPWARRAPRGLPREALTRPTPSADVAALSQDVLARL
jgi:hypothetical protein